MSVTLSEVKRAAKAHRAPLAGESAGYLVLAVADQVLSAPRVVKTSEIQLGEDGSLRVVAGRASSDSEAELGLRQALDDLLSVASSGSSALSRAGRRTAPIGLAALVRELEAALIPVNRSAAKRALARVHRETERALQAGTLPPDPPPIAVPTELPPVVAVAAPLAAPEELGQMLSALAEELGAPPQLEESDALTTALPVQLIADADADADVDAVDSGAAPTVMLAVAVSVEPVALTPAPDLPLEACTRPEPVVLRKSSRPEAPLASDALVRTPTLGSLAASLPVLSAERMAELEAEQLVHETEIHEAIPDLVVPLALETHAEHVEVDSDEVLTSIAPAVFESLSCETDEPPRADTEPLPPIVIAAPLSPGVAMVESRKSDVSELLASFRVGGEGELDGLPRAIKEMADLDLTPAPFAALIR